MELHHFLGIVLPQIYEPFLIVAVFPACLFGAWFTKKLPGWVAPILLVGIVALIYWEMSWANNVPDLSVGRYILIFSAGLAGGIFGICFMKLADALSGRSTSGK